jgi:hypothetical protein
MPADRYNRSSAVTLSWLSLKVDSGVIRPVFTSKLLPHLTIEGHCLTTESGSIDKVHGCLIPAMQELPPAHLWLEVEERRQGSSVWQAGVGVPQLVEEGVDARLEGRAPQRRGVLQQPGHQVHCLGGHALVEHLRRGGER